MRETRVSSRLVRICRAPRRCPLHTIVCPCSRTVLFSRAQHRISHHASPLLHRPYHTLVIDIVFITAQRLSHSHSFASHTSVVHYCYRLFIVIQTTFVFLYVRPSPAFPNVGFLGRVALVAAPRSYIVISTAVEMIHIGDTVDLSKDDFRLSSILYALELKARSTISTRGPRRRLRYAPPRPSTSAGRSLSLSDANVSPH